MGLVLPGTGGEAWAWSLLKRKGRRGHEPLLELKGGRELVPLLEREGRGPGPLLIGTTAVDECVPRSYF